MASRSTGTAQHQLSLAEQEARRLQASMVELHQQQGPDAHASLAPSRGSMAGGYAAWHPGGLHLEASIEKRIHVGNDLVRPLLAVTLRISSKQLLTHAFAYVYPCLALLSLHRRRATAEAPGRQAALAGAGLRHRAVCWGRPGEESPAASVVWRTA